MKVGFALTSEFQEAGRGSFHRVSRQNPEYKVSDTDKQYNKCLSAHRDGISIVTSYQMAKDAGIDISNPPKSQKSSVGTLDIWTYGSNSPMPQKNKYPAY
ncbi:MAG: PriCT-2 domain-containing protein [Bacteroidales bacterium]|nr:PriCT-2 domain-containing protein [Bacteroidales bacterium]MDY2705712.1 PriCT-2 domain-containing protein [Alloprevotella sp.]